MGFWQRVIPAKLRERISEALTGPAVGNSIGNDPALVGYRPLTARGSDGKITRNLDPLSREEMVNVCHFLYEGNPVGRWMIDQRTDLFLGAEVSYRVQVDRKALSIETDEEEAAVVDAVRKIIDAFWLHPSHRFNVRAVEYLTTYMVSGHLILPIASHNTTTGTPQLDVVDASQLDSVRMVSGSAMVADAVVIRGSGATEKKTLRVARVKPGASAYEEAEAFYFRNNRLLNAPDGRGELTTAADYVDALEQYVWTTLDKAKLQNNLIYDVTMEGAKQPEIDARLQALVKDPPNKPGAFWLHNEREKVEPKSITVHGADTAAMLKALLAFVVGSKHMPESWFGSGSGTNRSTAGEQTEVAYKSLERWQVITRDIFVTMLDYAWDRYVALQNGRKLEGWIDLPARPAIWFDLVLPKISERDVARVGQALGAIAPALSMAIEERFISRKTSRRVFLSSIEQLGVSVDIADEEAQIEAEAEEEEARKAEKQAAFWRNRDAMAALGQGGQETQAGDEGNGNDDGDEDPEANANGPAPAGE